MPAYNFKKQFVPMIESGEKAHTIRGKRKHRPKPGQRFVGYYGQRTKHCRKLVDSTITRVQDIEIVEGLAGVPFVILDGVTLCEDECEQLARLDGFKGFAHMMSFWDGRRPFSGDFIHWLPAAQTKRGAA